MRIAPVSVLVFGLLPAACHRTAPVQSNTGGSPRVRDTTAVVAVFRDSALVTVSRAEARAFPLQTRAQRDSLRATLKKERDLWRDNNLRDYQYLLRVDCFCPGRQGWLLMEVRRNQPLRAFDIAGKSTALTNWNTFSIDGLFDNLDRLIDIDGVIEVAFDPRWHFPAYISSVARPGPDGRSIVEARGLRPI